MSKALPLSCAMLDVLEWLERFGPTPAGSFRRGTVRAIEARGLVDYNETNCLYLTEKGREVLK